MTLAIFRVRMDPNNLDEYGRLAAEMSALAMTMPGYVSHKGYGAEDGENLVLVEFENEETMRRWGRDPRHAVAIGRASEFYLEYLFQVAEVTRENRFKR